MKSLLQKEVRNKKKFKSKIKLRKLKNDDVRAAFKAI